MSRGRSICALCGELDAPGDPCACATTKAALGALKVLDENIDGSAGRRAAARVYQTAVSFNEALRDAAGAGLHVRVEVGGFDRICAPPLVFLRALDVLQRIPEPPRGGG